MIRAELVAISLVLSACVSTLSFDPAAIDRGEKPSESVRRRIASLEAGTADQEETRRVVKVTYQGKPAYLFTAPCCDQFDYLYDSEGKRLCAPSGGVTGRGDGKCDETAAAKETSMQKSEMSK
jgi:hypothetical protein